MKNPIHLQRKGLTVLLLVASTAIGAGFGLYQWSTTPGRSALGTLLATTAWAESATPAGKSMAPADPTADTAADTSDSEATASDDTATSKTGTNKPAKAGGAKSGEAASVFAPDPLAKLADSLKERERKLDEREAALKKEEQRLEALRKETEQNLGKIELRLKEMQTISGEAAQKHKQDLTKWVNIYQGMAPEKAGPIIEGLASPFALELLSSMEPKKAGKILGNISAEKAIELGKKLDAPRH